MVFALTIIPSLIGPSVYMQFIIPSKYLHLTCLSTKLFKKLKDLYTVPVCLPGRFAKAGQKSCWLAYDGESCSKSIQLKDALQIKNLLEPSDDIHMKRNRIKSDPNDTK